MKKIIIVLSVFLAVNTVSFAQNNNAISKNMETQKTIYTCPMHPGERSMKEGECSKCGMKLVKTTTLKNNPAIKGSQASTIVKAKYVCKMDGSTSDKAGKCPKCGMEMTKENPKITYTCPMHPGEMSMKEGECSKCGMKLVKITKQKHNPAVKGSQASTVVETKYVCKMDGTTSDKAGKCSKCGMEMTPTDADNKAVNHQH